MERFMRVRGTRRFFNKNRKNLLHFYGALPNLVSGEVPGPTPPFPLCALPPRPRGFGRRGQNPVLTHSSLEATQLPEVRVFSSQVKALSAERYLPAPLRTE